MEASGSSPTIHPHHTPPVIGAHRGSPDKRGMIFNSAGTDQAAQKYLGDKPEVPWLTALPGVGPQRPLTMGNRVITAQTSSSSKNQPTSKVADGILNLGNHSKFKPE